MFTRYVFSDIEIKRMQNLYSKIFNVSASFINIPSVYLRYSTMKVTYKRLGSSSNISSNASIVLVLWATDPSFSDVEKRPAQINYFVKHAIEIDNVQYSLISVCVSWFKEHLHNSHYGNPVTVWEPDVFETTFSYDLLPVNFIACRTVSLIDEIDDLGNALFVVPCINF